MPEMLLDAAVSQEGPRGTVTATLSDILEDQVTRAAILLAYTHPLNRLLFTTVLRTKKVNLLG